MAVAAVAAVVFKPTTAWSESALASRTVSRRIAGQMVVAEAVVVAMRG